MPGAGKSTIGVLLAKQTSRDFIDTDLLIQVQQKISLQQVLDKEGYLALRKIEENALLTLNCKNYVIATGGSAVYSHPAMQHLESDAVIVFLQCEIDVLKKRIGDFSERGIAKRPGQTFQDLFNERYPLYKKYADITIACQNRSQDEIVVDICRKINM